MTRNLIKTLVRVYHTIPPGTRTWLGVAIFPLRMMVRGFASLCFDVYQIRGEEKEFYYITSSMVDPYFTEQFCTHGEITKTGELYAWNLRNFIRTHPTLIIEMHTVLSPFFRDGLMTVHWVRQVLDLQIPMEEILNHISERKKISAFQAEISTDIRDIHHFYEKVFTPYTLKRYPDARILDFASFNEKMLNNAGELLTITKNGIPAGGACSVLIGSTWYWRINGLTDERFLSEGAMAAIYYYCILRAKESGATMMDLGQSRPSINDGVLSFKRKWRAKISPDREARVVYLKNLKKEGLIVVEEKKFKILAFSEEHAALPRYADAGLEVKLVGPE